jgi:flagellar protein FliO/FliZ
MGFTEIISMVAALAVTLGLFGLAVWAWRKFAPAGLLQMAPRQRRMAIVESLVLDANRRLVLVTLDDQERLLLLGEGQLLGDLSGADKRP